MVNSRTALSRLGALSFLFLSMSGMQNVLIAQQTRPDNTGVNKRDRDSGRQTADQQTNNSADLKLAQQIRRAIVADKSLSSYARNVKVIAANGKVTLRGPVRSDAEKQTIQSRAEEVAGAANVVNELTIAPASPSKPKQSEQR
jgi:osmotically-inducible protein OsmY